MILRRLELTDAPLMLEWMHDKSVTEGMMADFSAKTINDAEQFIRKSWGGNLDIHLAVTTDDGEYMGTVSLKHICDNSAEFAIAVRKTAMGRGFAWFGMESILKKAFDELGLDAVYWCVRPTNVRAVRFYTKHNFHEIRDIPDSVLSRYAGDAEMKWYAVLKGDFLQLPDSVAGCKVINIKTISTLSAGELSFFEGSNDIPFDIKRIYYISKVPDGVRRGYHAHRHLKQLLFCPYGKIRLFLENRHGKGEIELSDPSVGILIEEPTWREMLWLKRDSVLCVAASQVYEPSDYIRDYNEFCRLIEKDG